MIVRLPGARPTRCRAVAHGIYISDMTQKEDMNRAWDEWADVKKPPMRAGVGAALAGDGLVEIVTTIAK